jgi:hypothetical protein
MSETEGRAKPRAIRRDQILRPMIRQQKARSTARSYSSILKIRPPAMRLAPVIRITPTQQVLRSRSLLGQGAGAGRVGSATVSGVAGLAAPVSDRDFLGLEGLGNRAASAAAFHLVILLRDCKVFSRPRFRHRRRDLRRRPVAKLHTQALRDIRGEHFGGGGGFHGRYGPGLYNLTGTVKVNLDHSAPSSQEKPVITAVAVDPNSQDIWAAVGKVLVHFDENGSYLGEYFLATPEGAPLRVSAVIVEPDRLIVASDSRGIYEFTRFDRNASRSSLRGAVVPPQGPQQNASEQ